MTTDYIEDLKKTLDRKTNDSGREHLKVTFCDFVKNNDTIRHACTVSLRNYTETYAAPTLYLEDFYDYYLNGMPIPRLADKILDCAEEYLKKPIVPPVDLSDYESVKAHLCVQLINMERNTGLLSRLVYSRFEDLAVIPAVLIIDPRMGQGCVKVRREHLQGWEVTEEQVMADALSSAPAVLPATFCSLEDILKELSRTGAAGEVPAVPQDEFYSGSVRDYGSTSETRAEEDPFTMYVLSNSRLTSGAASIVYPGVAEKIRRRIGTDYYLLPSSVNEWIVVRDVGQDPAGFRQIVQEVNRTEVPPEEVLSDSVYRYEEESGKIARIC